MIKIGYFSKLSRISIRMLRHYDSIGLLTPETIDDSTGYRYYVPAQLQDANRIVALRDMGFSLTSIAEILKMYHDSTALYDFLTVQLSEVQEAKRQAQTRLQLIESTMKRLREDEDSMKYDVILKEIPERTVASLRKTIPSYYDEGALWEEMMAVVPCESVATPPYGLAVFHDEGYKESDVDVEIQIAVQGTRPNVGNVVFKTAPEQHVVSVIFKGNYDQIMSVHEAIATWVSDNHYHFNGPMFNIYHVSPAHDPNPDNWVTEVCYPVKRD